MALQCSTDRRLGKWPDNSVILLGSSQSINNNSVPCGRGKKHWYTPPQSGLLAYKSLENFYHQFTNFVPLLYLSINVDEYTVMYWELQIFYFAIFMIFSTTPLSLIPAVHISIFYGFKFLQRDL